jgi:hypothetical protein
VQGLALQHSRAAAAGTSCRNADGGGHSGSTLGSRANSGAAATGWVVLGAPAAAAGGGLGDGEGAAGERQRGCTSDADAANGAPAAPGASAAGTTARAAGCPASGAASAGSGSGHGHGSSSSSGSAPAATTAAVVGLRRGGCKDGWGTVGCTLPMFAHAGARDHLRSTEVSPRPPRLLPRPQPTRPQPTCLPANQQEPAHHLHPLTRVCLYCCQTTPWLNRPQPPPAPPPGLQPSGGPHA